MTSPQVVPSIEVELGGLAVRRYLPRSLRRMVGAWCFLDTYGPVERDGKVMDVPPHPHIGIQTVSWLLSGAVLHKDSLGCTAVARPGSVNVMTSGRGIAHSEESPEGAPRTTHGVQLWVALPDRDRWRDPRFDAADDLPVVELDGARATVFMGAWRGAASPAPAFTPILGAELRLDPGTRAAVPLDRGFEHGVVLLSGMARLGDRALDPATLAFLAPGPSSLTLEAGDGPAVLLLLGGPPFGERILMWWNFVARSADEIREAREDWEAGRRFGEVKEYAGARLPAPPYVARPVPANPAS